MPFIIHNQKILGVYLATAAYISLKQIHREPKTSGGWFEPWFRRWFGLGRASAVRLCKLSQSQPSFNLMPGRILGAQERWAKAQEGWPPVTSLAEGSRNRDQRHRCIKFNAASFTFYLYLNLLEIFLNWKIAISILVCHIIRRVYKIWRIDTPKYI